MVFKCAIAVRPSGKIDNAKPVMKEMNMIRVMVIRGEIAKLPKDRQGDHLTRKKEMWNQIYEKPGRWIKARALLPEAAADGDTLHRGNICEIRNVQFVITKPLVSSIG